MLQDGLARVVVKEGLSVVTGGTDAGIFQLFGKALGGRAKGPCIGVAPAGDFAPTSTPSGTYGGNLDYNEIGEGTTVILPVFHPGALLFIGRVEDPSARPD